MKARIFKTNLFGTFKKVATATNNVCWLSGERIAVKSIWKNWNCFALVRAGAEFFSLTFVVRYIRHCTKLCVCQLSGAKYDFSKERRKLWKRLNRFPHRLSGLRDCITISVVVRKRCWKRLRDFSFLSRISVCIFKTQNIMAKLDKMVASNTLNANHNIMHNLEKNSVLYISLKRECERIVKRYPSLAWLFAFVWRNLDESTNYFVSL